MIFQVIYELISNQSCTFLFFVETRTIPTAAAATAAIAIGIPLSPVGGVEPPGVPGVEGTEGVDEPGLDVADSSLDSVFEFS